MKLTFTKSIILLSFSLILITGGEQLYAQKSDSLAVKSISKKQGKNLIQINLPAIALSNYSVVYQRAIGKKIAVGMGFRYMAESELPFKSKFTDLADDDTKKQIDNFRTGNIAFTPEIRFYMGKSVFRGFYVAPFAKYAKYDASLPFKFDVSNGSGGSTPKNIPLSGDLTTMTGGLLLGAQWKLSKLVYLDWWMLGPQFGTSEGSITGKQTLSSDEQAGLRDELKNLEDMDTPAGKITVKSTVDANGATVDFKGPWAGLRAGICLGFRF